MKRFLSSTLLSSLLFLWVSLSIPFQAQAASCGSAELWIKSIWPAVVELDPLSLHVKDLNSTWIINKSNASPYGDYAWGLSGLGPVENPSLYYLHTIYNFDGTTSIYHFNLETGASASVADLGIRAYGLAQNGDTFYFSGTDTVQRVGGGSITLPENIGGLDYVADDSGGFLLAIAAAYYSHNVYKISIDENGDPTNAPEIATTIQAGLDSPLYPYKYTSVSYARIPWEDSREREVLYVTKDDGSLEPWDVAAIVDFNTGEVLRAIDSRESGLVADPPITWPNGVSSDYLNWANPQGIEYVDGRLFLISRYYWNKGPLHPPSCTTLNASKTAAASWKRYVEYDWNIQKSVNPTHMTIPMGQSGSVTYTLTPSRAEISLINQYRVAGQICVTNTGAATTQDLKIVDTVQYKVGEDSFVDLAGASLTLLPSDQILPGQTQCYTYGIVFTPVPEAEYRNAARITLTNYSDHSGEEFGMEVKADFSLPEMPTELGEVDAEAVVTDSLNCPTGFTCTPPEVGPFSFTGSDPIQWTEIIQNISAVCNGSSELTNNVTLTEKNTGQQRVASATVALSTGSCPGINCTRTIGYWKNHPKKIKPFLPIWLGTGMGKSIQVTTVSQAVDILNRTKYGTSSNGISKLYAQLLAANLNIKNGADPSAVAAILLEINNFLASYDWRDWKRLTEDQKQTVLGWKTILDNYNNGLLGPGHCD